MNRKQTLCLILASVIIMVLLAAVALSAEKPVPAGPDGLAGGMQNNPSVGSQEDTSRQPPAEAIAACSGRSAGDTCQFSGRAGPASGTCDERPGILACAPQRAMSSEQVSRESPSPQSALTTTLTKTPGSAPSVIVTPAAGTGNLTLTSEAGTEGGTMPDEYSCDGAGASPALSWSGAPAGTKEFALMMTTLPVDGSTRWNWVLYHIPGTATGIARNGSSIGALGTGSHGTVMMYDPPCSQGPGAKRYTFTLYALSASPDLPANPAEVTGPVLTSAISDITLDKASLDLYHARAGQS